jgi:hypothetical protein
MAPTLTLFLTGECIVGAHHITAPKLDATGVDPVHSSGHGRGRPASENRIACVESFKTLPLDFPFAPAHHQHHQQKSCGEPKNGLHNHVIHDRRFSFLIL